MSWSTSSKVCRGREGRRQYCSDNSNIKKVDNVFAKEEENSS